jgi:hypothetical protein
MEPAGGSVDSRADVAATVAFTLLVVDKRPLMLTTPAERVSDVPLGVVEPTSREVAVTLPWARTGARLFSEIWLYAVTGLSRPRSRKKAVTVTPI